MKEKVKFTDKQIEDMLNMPELQVSLTVEGETSLVAVIKHLIERSEIIGALNQIQEEF